MAMSHTSTHTVSRSGQPEIVKAPDALAALRDSCCALGIKLDFGFVTVMCSIIYLLVDAALGALTQGINRHPAGRPGQPVLDGQGQGILLADGCGCRSRHQLGKVHPLGALHSL